MDLDETPRDNRRKALEARLKQVEFYQEWSQAEQKEGVNGICEGRGVHSSAKKRKCGVTFATKDKLRDAVTRSDIAEVRAILAKLGGMSNVDVVSEASGVSLLHTCCVNEDVEGVRLLLQHGAKVNVQDNDLWTPLHVAAACCTSEIVELLLQHGADATILDVDGNFPSDNTDCPVVLGMLMQHLENVQGIRAGDLATIRCQQARSLISAIDGCIMREETVDDLNDNGVAFLHIAAANGYCEVVKLLLDAGANINIQDDLGYTPLHLAAKFNQVKATKLLLKRRAATQIQSHHGEMPIDLAENDEILRFLEFAGGGQKLRRIPSVLASHPYLFPAVSPPETSSHDIFGPPSPSMKRMSMVGGRTRLYSVDMGEFQRERTRSKTKDWKTKPSMAKLEKVYESNTLEEKDTFDEGSDLSTQGPLLDKLKGSFLQRRQSEQLVLPDALATDNLATLSDLTEDIVLQYLQQRYHQDQIYTYIGEILVAVNPFKQLDFYTNLVSEQYSADPPNTSLPPHIYAVGNQVYRTMMRANYPQCCVISGESGAGKTETCKLIVQQLLYLTESEEIGLNIKIEQVNPILEAFGNAKTVMNNNSSRFGKYLELVFTPEGKLLGATYKEYLLEKLRVVVQGSKERNFHIFYLMFAGLEQEEKIKLKLVDLNSHRCVSGSDLDIDEDDVDRMARQFQEVRDSLRAVGFSEQDDSELLEALAAVLHICDVTFQSIEEEGGSGNVGVVSQDHVTVIADLLQVEPDDLLACFTTETIYTRGEEIVRGRNEVQAKDSRDAIAKAVYGRMFSWIVNGINHHLKPEDVNDNHSYKVGLLDIFGFEKFEHNSFEQMCINIANEQLQFYFNQHIFQWELDECAKEGVALVDVQYTSNAPVIDMFLARATGLLALVDEESKFPRATDKSLALKLHQSLGVKGGGEIYHMPPNQGTSFGISHYAGYVEYDIVGFLDKNRDTLPPAVTSLMRSSSSVLIREIFGGKLTRTGSVAASLRQSRSRKEASPFAMFNMKTSRRMSKMMQGSMFPRRQPKSTDTARRKPPTVSNHFQNSLKDLMDKMNSAHPHFVRCIKPNSLKQPMNYDTEYVQTQLRYTGVMETTRIRRCGYPTRINFEDFLKRYADLAAAYAPPPFAGTSSHDEDRCRAVLASVGVEGWACGKSKVMLKFDHTTALEAQCSILYINAVVIQRAIRDWLRRKRQQRLAAARELQREQLHVFFAGVSTISQKCFRKQVLLNRIDTKNYFRKKKEAEKKEKAERKLREEEEQRRRLEEEKKRQEEKEKKRLEQEEKKRKEEEEEKNKEEEEKRKREAEEKLEAARKLREEEEQRRRLEEEKRRIKIEEEECKRQEEDQKKGKELERKLEEEREARNKKAATLPFSAETTMDNLHRGSAVLSGQSPRIRRKNPSGSAAGENSEGKSRAAANHRKGGGAEQNGHSYANGGGKPMRWKANGHNLGNDFGREFEEGPGGINHFSSVEDSNLNYEMPLKESFEPVTAGLKRPQRRLMKIRSNPLSDSSGSVMVVSDGSSNGLHPTESDDLSINGYMFSGAPAVSNGHGGFSSPDEVIGINGDTSLLIGSGGIVNGGEHVQNKIVLTDYDHDDSVSPTAGDLAEDIYEETIPVVTNGVIGNGLTPNTSDDNIYDEVGSTDNSDELDPDTFPCDYCEPISLKVRTSSPDFNQTPAAYRDPATVMTQPPTVHSPTKAPKNDKQKVTPDEPYEVIDVIAPAEILGSDEQKAASDEPYEPVEVHAPAKIPEKQKAASDQPYEPVEVGPIMPLVPLKGEKAVKKDAVYENATNIQQNQPGKGVDAAQKQSKINPNSPLRMSYFTGISPIDDEDYSDTDTLPPVSKNRSTKPPSSPRFHRRNVSLDNEVFLPGDAQPLPSSSSSIYNKTQHNTQLHRRHGTKLKKSSSSSVDHVTSMSSQSSAIGGSQEVLNTHGVSDTNPKSPESPKKRCWRGLKKSDSEGTTQLSPGGVKANSPESPKKQAHKVLKKCVSDSSPLPVYNRLDHCFSPTAPLPPVPTEVPSRSNMPLPPPPSQPPPPPSPYSIPGAVIKSLSGGNVLRDSGDYDYIGSNTLEKAVSDDQASPYLEYKHQALPMGPPQPYTPPIQRKPKKLCKSTSFMDEPPKIPPPLMPHKPLSKSSSSSSQEEDPILSRPPALPPVILTGNRPPAPLPPEAMMQELPDKNKPHKPLSHARSLYTQGSSTSTANVNNRPHPPLTRGASAAALSSVPEAPLQSNLPGRPHHNSASESPPSTSPNRSPRIPPRFPRNKAPPPSTAPQPVPPPLTGPPSAVPTYTTPSAQAPPPNSSPPSLPLSAMQPLPPLSPVRDVSNGSSRPPPPPGPPPTCTSTSSPPKMPASPRKPLGYSNSLMEPSAKKPLSQPPSGSNISALASSFTHNSVVEQIHAAVNKQQLTKETESASPAVGGQSTAEKVQSEVKKGSNLSLLKTKLRSVSSGELNAVPASKSSHSNQSSPLSASSAAKSVATSASSSGPSDNSMPEWKRALLEKRQQQQLQKQQSKGDVSLPKKEEVKDSMPEWKKALLERKAKGQQH